MDSVQVNLLADRSARKKRKISFIILLTILFTLTISTIIFGFTVLKRHTESQYPSTNSVRAIRVVCSVTWNPHHCTTSISALYNRRRLPFSKTDPSMIFTLSLHVAINKLKPLISLPKNTDCGKLFNDSLSQLNGSLISSDGKKSMDNETMVRDLTASIKGGISNIDKCLKRLESMRSEWRIARVKFYMVKVYMGNSLQILQNKNVINEQFYPDVRTILASLMLKPASYCLSLILICSQYLVIVFLVCILLRVR